MAGPSTKLKFQGGELLEYSSFLAWRGRSSHGLAWMCSGVEFPFKVPFDSPEFLKWNFRVTLTGVELINTTH